MFSILQNGIDTLVAMSSLLLVPGKGHLTVAGPPSYFEAGAAWMSASQRLALTTWDVCVFEGPWGLLFSPPGNQLSHTTLGFGLKTNTVNQTV